MTLEIIGDIVAYFKALSPLVRLEIPTETTKKFNFDIWSYGQDPNGGAPRKASRSVDHTRKL